MGTVVKATGISIDRHVQSSIAHAAIAAKSCIESAGIRTEEIDIMINIGVYRDSNMVEPSMAALIQQEIGLNLDFLKYNTPKTAFSFDLMNGACGILNAIQASRAYIELGDAEYVLIVSSDAHPSNKEVESFPYATLGGAMLLARADRASSDLADVGFGKVLLRASKDESHLGTSGFWDRTKSGLLGRETLHMSTHPEYKEKLVDLAVKTAKEYIAAEKIDLTNTLLVTSQPMPDLGAQVARALGVGEESVVRLDPAWGVARDPHTSALTLAYHQAAASGQLAKHDKALFIAVGAGMTSACALYRW